MSSSIKPMPRELHSLSAEYNVFQVEILGVVRVMAVVGKHIPKTSRLTIYVKNGVALIPSLGV